MFYFEQHGKYPQAVMLVVLPIYPQNSGDTPMPDVKKRKSDQFLAIIYGYLQGIEDPALLFYIVHVVFQRLKYIAFKAVSVCFVECFFSIINLHFANSYTEALLVLSEKLGQALGVLVAF